MGYSDKTWYVGSVGQKNYPCGWLSTNAHIQYLFSMYVLIDLRQKKQISRQIPEFCIGCSYETRYVGSGDGISITHMF